MHSASPRSCAVSSSTAAARAASRHPLPPRRPQQQQTHTTPAAPSTRCAAGFGGFGKPKAAKPPQEKQSGGVFKPLAEDKPCPCGSGQEFKVRVGRVCCLRFRLSLRALQCLPVLCRRMLKQERPPPHTHPITAGLLPAPAQVCRAPLGRHPRNGSAGSVQRHGHWQRLLPAGQQV
jgi:hypothetical protein